VKHIKDIIEEYMKDKGYKMDERDMEETDKLKAMTSILKKKLMYMMVQKWNGKDFTNLDELSGMANDILEVIADMGNNELG